ncbi:hypothetical protein [Streptomyces collinus]
MDVFIEFATASPTGWHWVVHPAGPAAEMVYNRAELIDVMRTYGRWGSVMANGGHIRITARGRFSQNRWLGEWQWVGHHPMSDPWIHVPAWPTIPFAAQLVIPPYAEHDDHKLVDTGATDVRTLRMRPVPADDPVPDQGPHVGHRHDVPNEGALPDLYGLRHASGDRFTE